MTDLDLRLRALNVAWPPTPELRLELAPRRQRRRVLVAALAGAALAAAFAVPQSRSALLRFFHLGGVTIERVDTLPSAQERPLSAGLGDPVDDAEAARALSGPFLPARHGTLYEQADGIVSTLLRGPLLLSEFGSGQFLKKFMGGTHVEWVEVAPGVQGIWLSGDPHVVFFPDSSPRLAGDVLVWAAGDRTFRLEGADLERERALRLARRILGTQ
jgi:hypothetical protein